MRRPISLCTGEVLSPSLGVLRQERIANNESRLSSFAFKSSPFQVFTAFSTFPFTCGYLGPEVLVLELPICGEILEFLVVKFRTVIADQHFRNAMSGKLHLKLGNYSLCCPPVNLNYFKEIGPVVYHYQECLMPNDKQICGNFQPKAQRKFMWLKLLASLC